MFTELGDLLYLPEAQLILAQIAIEQGDLSQAKQFCAEVLHHYQEPKDEHGISNVLHVLAWISLTEDKTLSGAEHAAKLFSESVSLREKVNRILSPAEQARNQLFQNALNQRLNSQL